MPENTELLIGLGLFALSEAIGLSRAKENTVLQMVLKIAMRAFPYEIRGEDSRKDHRLKRDR